MDHQHANKVIRFKAEQLARRKGFSKTDREDIAQELWLHVWANIGKFDPDRASERTFIVRIIESKAASIARHRSAAKRNPDREEVSLQEVVSDDDGRLAAAAEMPSELRDGFGRALEGEPSQSHPHGDHAPS